ALQQFRQIERGLNLHAGQHAARVLVQLGDLVLDLGQGEPGRLVLAHQDDAFDLIILVLPDYRTLLIENRLPLLIEPRPADTDAAKTGLVADRHTLANFRDAGTAQDQVLDAHRHIVDRNHHDVADLLDAMPLRIAEIASRAQGTAEAQHFLHRITTFAEQADGPDVNRIGLERQGAGAHIGITGRQGSLQLLQANAVALQSLGIGVDFVALDHAAEAGDIGDAR